MAAIPLQAKRRKLIAAYASAARRHQRRATLARDLIAITCTLLKAEIRAAKRAAPQPSPQADLFSEPPGAAP